MPGRPDLALGAHQPLGHRRLGDEERPRDLAGASARRACAGSAPPARRCASAGWQQVKTSSSRSSGNVVVVHRRPPRPRAPRAARVFAASVRSRRMRSIARLRAVVTQPRAGVGRDAVARPALGRDRERLLRGLLGEVEVAEEADQGGEDAAPLVAEGPLERRHHSTIGRTSIAPPRRAAGIRAASSIAASRSSASKMQVAAEGLLGLDERAVGGERPPVLHPDRRRRLGRLRARARA